MAILHYNDMHDSSVNFLEISFNVSALCEKGLHSYKAVLVGGLYRLIFFIIGLFSGNMGEWKNFFMTVLVL
jgi:hypothetical protein